ncbi:MAG: hypothetical protein GWN00_26430, partial [Aliifodinibius sp.]|nr:hypothetical protein [Fodinibius sp.]NIX58088.1 hypothetical protein [candidate division Zixibacteria bacterium]NIY28210.1 hypothetical protein [Fodinibius sp.]
KRFSNLAYIKPVGQQYRWIQGEKIDKDAVLFQSTYKLPDRLRDMSPIAIPKGFTTNYINQGKQDVLVNQIHNAYQSLSRGKDFV